MKAVEDNEQIELDLFLESIFRKYGYDFRNYSKAHLRRRISRRLRLDDIDSISEYQHQILYNENVFQILLNDLSINVTEMFRDPAFYLAIRKKVIPILKQNQFLKIWHAGCSSGEEVYSMAILLKEEGIYDKCTIYATDFNQRVLEAAKEGIYKIDRIKEYTINYQEAGGKNTFSDYYSAKYDSVIMDKKLKTNIVFADHNLVTDSVFGEMNMVICRNVLIYFDRKLQDRVVKLFHESLVDNGILGIGSKESLAFSSNANDFDIIDKKEKIFQKKTDV